MVHVCIPAVVSAALFVSGGLPRKKKRKRRVKVVSGIPPLEEVVMRTSVKRARDVPRTYGNFPPIRVTEKPFKKILLLEH